MIAATATDSTDATREGKRGKGRLEKRKPPRPRPPGRVAPEELEPEPEIPGLRMSQHTMGVSAKFSPALLARLDSIAAGWGLDRSATLRRLVEIADVEAAAPLEVPSMEELVRIAAEKARSGNMSAVAWLAQRQPDEGEANFRQLLERLGAGSQ
jgi:hypothetical protein